MPDADAPKRVNITVSPQVEAYLEDLADLGLHGSTATAVAGRLVTDAILGLIREGILTKRHLGAEDD